MIFDKFSEAAEFAQIRSEDGWDEPICVYARRGKFLVTSVLYEARGWTYITSFKEGEYYED